jgi:hypothetical protein
MKKKLIKFKNTLIKYLKDPLLFLSFIIAWMITNGWAYLFIVFGTIFKIKWMLAIGTSYTAILWLPCTPEKLITIPLAIFIKKILFKKR